MTTIECPHCKKLIELVGQRELSEDYGMGPNPVQQARQHGSFPIPVLQFGNRNMWFKSDIEEYVQRKRDERIARLVEDFEQTIADLPDKERDQARKMLASTR